MAIVGAHALLYSTKPDALRATLRDVFGWKHVDAGDGWLIFALPPAELAVHPADESTAARHELCFMCDDITATADELRGKGLEVGEPTDMGWGISATVGLPGGVEALVYEPR